MITVGEGRLDTRRTADFDELTPAGVDSEAVAAVVGALSAERVRLVTTSGVESEEELSGEELAAAHTTVTIAHEKLIDAWPWLRRLIDENRELIMLQNHIHNDARQWAEEKDPGYLYRTGRLLHVEENMEKLQPSMDELSLRFIQASIDVRQTELDRSRIRSRVMVALATVVIITTCVGLFFINFAYRGREDNVATTNNEAAARLLSVEIARYYSDSTSAANDNTEVIWQSSDFIKLQCELAARNLSLEEWEQFYPGEDYRCTCQQWPAGWNAPSDAPGCAQ